MEAVKKVVLCGVNGYSSIELLKSYVMQEYPYVDFQFLGDLALSEADFITKAAGAQVVLSQYQPMTDKIYKSLPELKAFCAMGAGYNAANLAAATKRGVIVTNVPDYCTEEVANHTVALILLCHRKIMQLKFWTQSSHWGYSLLPPLPRLSSCTVGFYGFGRIAQQTALRLAPFGMKILVCSPHAHDQLTMYPFVTEASFDELVEKADFISLHSPLTCDNHHLFNKTVFNRMKSSAYLINTARGALINAADLLAALLEKKIAGAALDVFEAEPFGNEAEKQLLQLPNVIVTGHTGFYSDDALEELTRTVGQEAGRILRGEVPLHWVNGEALSKGQVRRMTFTER